MIGTTRRRWQRLVGVVCCAIAWSSVAADPPSDATLPAPELFFRVPAYRSLSLSPDGRLLAAIVPIHGRANLALVDLENRKVEALTSLTDDDVFDYRWLGDRVVEIKVADLDEAGGISRLRQHLLVDVVDRRILRDLLKVARFGAVDVLEATDPTGAEVLIATLDRNVYGRDVYRFDARTGEKQLLTLRSPGDVTRFVADRQGQVRIAVSSPRGGQRTLLSYRPTNDDAWVTLRDDPVGEESLDPLVFDDDGRTLYVRVPAPERGGLRDIFAFDTGTGRLGERVFTAKDVDAGGVIYDRVLRRAVGFRDGSKGGIAWTDPQWDQVQRSIDQALPGAHNRLSWARDNRDRVLVASETESTPTAFYLLDRRTLRMERVAQSYPWLKDDALSPRRLVQYAARDGLRIPAYLTMPKRPAGDKPPLIVDIHGGPYVYGAHFGYDGEAQFFASRGYAVLQPNFRGTLGYGDAFAKAGLRQWGLAMQDDLTDGVRWLIDSGQVDPKRVCLFGASYGGYATLWGLAKEPALFRCGVAFLAVSDLELMFDANWSDFMLYERGDDATNYLRRAIGDPDKDRDRMRAVSPVRHADRIQAPLLLAYGAEDRRVPIIHGNRMRSALDEAGKPYEWVVYGNQQHVTFGPENRADFYRRVDVFLARHLDGRAAAVSPNTSR